MSSPPGRRVTVVLGVLLWTGALFALPVAAQRPPDLSPSIGLSASFDAVLGAFVTLVVGGGLVVLAPEFTERTTDRVLEEPGGTFLYGLGIVVAAFVLAVLLAVTVVGILLVVPLLVALVVVGTFGFLATGRAVVDDLGTALLVAVLVSAVTSGVPYLGGLVGFVIASMGSGAWYLEYRDDGAGPGDGTPGVDPVSGDRAEVTAAADAGDRGAGRLDSTASEPGDDSPGATGAAAEASTDPGDGWTAGFEDDLDRE